MAMGYGGGGEGKRVEVGGGGCGSRLEGCVAIMEGLGGGKGEVLGGGKRGG